MSGELISCIAVIIIIVWGLLGMLAAWPEKEYKKGRWVRKRH